MTRTRRLWTGLLVCLGVLLLAGAILVALVPSDEALALRFAAALQATLGVKVSIGAVHWQVLPVPVVVIENAATLQPQPVVIKKLTLFLDANALLRRSLKINRADLEGALVPQLSLRELGIHGGGAPLPGSFVAAELLLARFEFRDVTWISRRGIAVVYAGEADFDPQWRPRAFELRRPGVQPPVDFKLTRQGAQDSWTLGIVLGGGTANGQAQLQTLPNGRLRLAGRLQPRGVELASALSAFNLRPVIFGRASGETRLSASGGTALDLAQTLRTETAFNLQPATLLRFDLEKAVRSAGKEHAGQTRLDSVAGQLDTQNTQQGMVLVFSRLQARSGVLSASGEATLANQHVKAALAVDLVEGVVGVPLTLSGPTDAVRVSVPGGAVAGAVVGTAVLPGVGTVIGARLGAALGRVFGAGQTGNGQLPSAKRAPQNAP